MDIPAPIGSLIGSTMVASECDDVIRRAHVSRSKTRGQQAAGNSIEKSHVGCFVLSPSKAKGAKQPISDLEQILGRKGGSLN